MSLPRKPVPAKHPDRRCSAAVPGLPVRRRRPTRVWLRPGAAACRGIQEEAARNAYAQVQGRPSGAGNGR
jgi:hypothetical protein